MMFDVALIRIGSRVLDIGAGTGEQTLLAARLSGPTGSVVAVDISTHMLELTAQAVRQAALNNVETREMDAQHLDFPSESFDSAISRNCLQFMPDLVETLAGIRRVLKTNGAFAALAWGERNPLLTIPQAIIRRRLDEPDPISGAPGQFALAQPHVLEEGLNKAGFRDVTVRVLALPRRFATMAEALSSAKQTMNTGSPYGGRLTKLSDRDRESVWTETEQEFRNFESPTGIEIPGEIVLATATK